MTYTKDQTVKYATPANDAESALRFSVLEDRDSRLLVAVIGAKGLGHQVCYDKSEFQPV